MTSKYTLVLFLVFVVACAVSGRKANDDDFPIKQDWGWGGYTSETYSDKKAATDLAKAIFRQLNRGQQYITDIIYVLEGLGAPYEFIAGLEQLHYCQSEVLKYVEC